MDNYHNTNNISGRFEGNNQYADQTPHYANDAVNGYDAKSKIAYSNGATSQSVIVN